MGNRQALQVPQAQAPVLDAMGWFGVVWYRFFQNLASEIPQIGDCIVQAKGDVTDNYYICDGSAISRVINQQLFAVIGVAYGPGDGMTTFNLPNFASIGAPSFWKIRFK